MAPEFHFVGLGNCSRQQDRCDHSVFHFFDSPVAD
jgi:hypothetical protein